MSPFLLLGLPAFSWLGGSLVSFVAVMILALVWRRALPERFVKVRSNLVQQPVHSVVRGFVIAGGAVAALALLVVTVIGIPLAFAIGCALSIGSYVGLAIACSLLGAALPIESLRGNEKRQIVAGCLVAFILVQVPFLGPLVGATLAMGGIGALRRASSEVKQPPHPYRDAGSASSFASL